MGKSKTALITVACQSLGYAQQSADCQELISHSMELLRSDHSVSLTSLLANTWRTILMLKASSVIPQVPRDVLYGVSSAAFLTFHSSRMQNSLVHRQTRNLRIQSKKNPKHVSNLSMLLHKKSIKLRQNSLACCIMILSKTLSLLKFTEKYIKCERIQCTKIPYWQ